MTTPIKAATLLKEASSNNRGVILVRPIKANSVDREAINVMGKKIFDESRYAHDRKYNREAVDELLNEWGRGSNIFCSIAELNGKCIGAMAGFIQECWFAHGNVAYDFSCTLSRSTGGPVLPCDSLEPMRNGLECKMYLRLPSESLQASTLNRLVNFTSA